MLRKLYLIFLLIGFTLSAQDQRIELKGVITYHSKPQKDIHIFNINAHSGTVSDENGRFSILIRENDTLLVSGIQFYSVGLYVSKEIVKKAYIEIDLMQRVNTLSEVRVYSHKLDGFLVVDSEKEEPVVQPEKEALALPPVDIPSKSMSRKLDPEYLPDPTDPAPEGGGDILGLVNLLTNNSLEKIGKTDTNKKKDPYLKADVLRSIHLFFDDPFFTEQLNIPQKDIDIFLAYADRNDRATALFLQKKYLELTDLLYRSSLSFSDN